MNILYICYHRTSDKAYQDLSVRYRCFNPAQGLSSGGITADVATFDMVNFSLLDRYDLIVFHRPAISNKLEKLVNRAEQRNCTVIADFDDFIFNPDYADQSPSFLNSQHPLAKIKDFFKRKYDALFLFDHFSVSTTPLVAEIKKIRPAAEVTVLHNYLSDVWLRHAQRLCLKRPGVKRITYLPGTNSHDHDFEVVQNVLKRFLKKNTDAILRVVGPLKFIKKKYIPRQLEHAPYVPYPLLPGLICDSWVTIAPLADNIFNNCKSGLKYFESAAFGVPVVASPIADMQRLESEALHLADTPNQWLKAFKLLSDKKYYERCSLSGIAHVKENCVLSHEIYKKAFAKYLQHEKYSDRLSRREHTGNQDKLQANAF